MSPKCDITTSLLSLCSATLVNILTAAWLTGYSPVLTIGFSTRITASDGTTPAIAAAHASAALSTLKKYYKIIYPTWSKVEVGYYK